MRQTTAEAFKKRYGDPVIHQESPWLFNKSEMLNKDIKKSSVSAQPPPSSESFYFEKEIDFPLNLR